MTEFEQKLIKALILARNVRNDPEAVKGVVDKAIGAEEDVIPIDFDGPASDGATQIDKHFGEEQTEGLDNLLEGLKDTPHDNRW